MKLFLLVSCFVAVGIAVPAIDDWISFKAKFGKSYTSEREEEFRRGVYLSTKQMIDEHNEKYREGLVSYKMKMNHFGDQLQHEITAVMNGLNVTEQIQNQNGLLYPSPSNVRVPSSIDWREKGAVTPVKNQGKCGSCWAFSTTGSVEGQLFRKTGRLISLSEQNLIDCSGYYNNNGCEGGLMVNAFDYIKDNGVEEEDSYPYEGLQRECRYRESESVTSVRGYETIPEEDEDALKQAISEIGPVSVAINAGIRSFSFYSGGVYNDEACSKKLNHGVLAVGYGTENGQDYWLIKNSWGPFWGEGGYVKIARNQDNLCGVASMASYPLL